MNLLWIRVVCILFIAFKQHCFAQISGGINLSNRRVLPPRIAPSGGQSQQPLQPQQQRPTNRRVNARPQQPTFSRFAPNPDYFNAMYLRDRINRLESDMGRFSAALNSITGSIRMTVNTYVGDRLSRAQQDIQGNTVRIDDNQGNIDKVSQELEYIKNSNANMQKRMNRIEETQRTQGETLENIEALLQALQQHPGTLEVLNNASRGLLSKSPADDDRLDALSASITSLKKDMNDTEEILALHRDNLRSAATNILTLSDQTNALQRGSISVAQWISSIRGDLSSLTSEVVDLQATIAEPELTKQDDDNVLAKLQSSLEELNNTVKAIEDNQLDIKFALNSTLTEAKQDTTPTEEVYDIADEYADENTEMLLELASSIADIEESMKKFKENQAIFTDETNLRISSLTTALPTQDQVDNLNIRLMILEENNPTQKIVAQLKKLNTTVGQNSFALNSLEKAVNVEGAIALRSGVEIGPKPSKNSSAAQYLTGERERSIQYQSGNFVTFSVLEKELAILRKNLTAFQKSTDLEKRITSPNLSQFANEDLLSDLQTNIDVLNSSAAVQRSMLSQAIQAISDHGSRLRRAEEKEHLLSSKRSESSLLLANITNSLSQMSLTVAENQLQISGLSENARMGDEILLDLNQQLYTQQMAIAGLNRTIGSQLQLKDAEILELKSASISDSNRAYSINKQNENDRNTAYVTQAEFATLADTFVGIVGRFDTLNQEYLGLKSSFDGWMYNTSRHNSFDAKKFTSIWTEINATKSLLEFLQNVIASISTSNVELRQDLTGLSQSLASMQTNSSASLVNSGLYGDEFIHLLDTSVRELRIDVNEQKKFLGNQRRRIRQLEDELLQTYVKLPDFTMLNETVTRRLRTIEAVIKSLTTNVFTKQANRSAHLAMRESQNASSFEDKNVQAESASIQELQNEIDIIMNRLDKQTSENLGNLSENIRDEFYEEIRTVPLTLRILEGQVNEFQGTIQKFSQLEAEVGTLTSMRNLVFQNSRDITSFHQTVADLEVEIDSVKRKQSLVEFSNQRLNAYQDDLRSKMNNTRRILDKTIDKNVIQDQKLRIWDRYLEGNRTELNARIKENKLRLDDYELRFSTVTNELKTDLSQQVSSSLQRHHDVDTRLSRDEKKLEFLEGSLTQNSDSLTTLTHDISEEVNTRSSEVESHANDLQSLRSAVENLQRKETSLKHSLSQKEQQLNEIVNTQNRLSDDVVRTQNLYQTTFDEVQDASRALQSFTDEQNSFSNKINNVNTDITELRQSFNSQASTLLSLRQSLIVANDEMNSLQQSIQSNNAFIRHAQHTLDKHDSDVAYILEHFSNHSAAIERLKHRVVSGAQAPSNTTNELFSGIQALEYDVREINDEIEVVKRRAGVREAAALRIEERINEIADNFLAVDSKTRASKETVDRLRSDLTRYTDRVLSIENSLQEQAVARDDLQQVVISNRNKLAAQSEIQSTLERLQSDVTSMASAQVNKSASLQHSLDDINRKLPVFTNRLSEHDNFLRTLRQERISSEANIEQILQSSNNLEQLLLETVSDLSLLKRDFEQEADLRSSVPRLQRTVSTIESEFQATKQTVTSNESKLSRMQDLVDRSTVSVNNLLIMIQNRIHNERSRDHSRTNEIREFRNTLSRSSTMLRTIQNELQLHNERLQLLNQRVNDVDNRIAISLSQIPQEQPNTENHDLDYAASGWLPLQASKNQKENDKNVADSEKSEIIELQKGYSDLLQRVESLSVSISSMSENVFKLETMQVSSSALSDVKTQLSNLTDVVDILQKTSFSPIRIRSGVSQLFLSLVSLLENVDLSSWDPKPSNVTPTTSSYDQIPSFEIGYDERDYFLGNETEFYHTEDYELSEEDNYLDSEVDEEPKVVSMKELVFNSSLIFKQIADAFSTKMQNNGAFAAPNEKMQRQNLTLTQVLNRLTSVEENFVRMNASILKLEEDFPNQRSVELTTDRNMLRQEENNTMNTMSEDDVIRTVEKTLLSWKEVKGMRENISLLSISMSRCMMQNEMLQHNMVEMKLKQESSSKKLKNLRNITDDIEWKMIWVREMQENKLLEAEERLESHISDTRQQLGSEQSFISKQVAELQHDLSDVNTTAANAQTLCTTLESDFASLLTKQLPQMQVAANHTLTFITDVQTKQARNDEKIDAVQRSFLQFQDQFSMVSDDINNLNYDIEMTKNFTNSLFNAEKRSSLEDRALINQKLSFVEEELSRTSENISSLAQAQSLLVTRLHQMNLSGADVASNFHSLQLQTEQLTTDQNDLQLSFTRHSMELRGLSGTIQTFDNLIGTLTESVTLQGKRINALFEQGFASDDDNNTDDDDDDVAGLTLLVSNHSYQIKELKNQMSSLSTRINTQPSVRIVVPNVERIPDPTTITSTATTTTPLYIPPPSSISVTSSRAEELMVSWIPPSDPKIMEYRIIIKNLRNANDILQIAAVAPPVTVLGLQPSARYLITVYSLYNSQLSAPLSVQAETGSAVSPLTTATTASVPTSTYSTTPASTTPDPNSIFSDILSNSGSDNSAPITIFSCNFESSDICGFINAITDDFDWTQWNGSTTSSDTGPSADHTFANDSGFYMFIEASRPRQSGDVARLLSRIFQPTNGQCLTFYYHMYGIGTGSLNVMLSSTNGNAETRIWGASGDRGNQWKQAKVSITSSYPFQLAFDAVRGSDYHADTAIDDVIIQDGACPQPLLQCNFENPDICGFIQDYDDDFDWDRHHGATSSADTGPVADHTLGTPLGFYLYIESSNPRQPDDKSRLSTPILRSTSGQCLKFYYHMHGSDIGALNIYMRQDSNPTLGVPLWNRTGAQGNTWLLGQVSLVSPESFQIVLEGVRGNDYHGDIAIDDVALTDGVCTNPVCSSGKRFHNACYEIVKDPKTYSGAESYCGSKGGVLTVMKTRNQQDFLTNSLNTEEFQLRSFWIGLNDRDTEGRFVFSDNSLLDAGSNLWAVGEPNDLLGDSDCVRVEVLSDGPRWNDVACDTELGFICQYPAS